MRLLLWDLGRGRGRGSKDGIADVWMIDTDGSAYLLTEDVSSRLAQNCVATDGIQASQWPPHR